MNLYDLIKGFAIVRSMRGEADGGKAAASLPRAGLGRLRVAMNVTFDQASREVGLSEQQAELLCAAMAPARSIGDLAGVLHCDQSNVSRLVDRAAARGLLQRQGGQRDGRVTVVELTPEGRQLAMRFIETLESKIEPLLAEWSEERQAEAVETLTAISETLEASQSAAAMVPADQTPPSPPDGEWVVGVV